MKKYLIIGPLLRPDGSNLGGATVSLNYLVEYLQKTGQPHELLDTQFFTNRFLKILNPIRVLVVFLIKIFKTDVVFVNVSQFGVKTISPVLYILTKFFGKKFVMRPFGGAMRDHYEKYNSLQKIIFEKTILQADIFYLQTGDLVDYFSPKGKNILKLPTSRNAPPPEYLRSNRSFQKRFLFLGHVNSDKGIDYLLEAGQELGAAYIIDIYGPIQEKKYRSIFQKRNQKAKYQGVLKKEEVLPTLQKYDVLILPTHYRGEGYPGAIIEAYSLGLPVITTNWRAIPEIVEDRKTGLLISTKSADDLAEAIEFFDKNNYPEFSANARRYFLENFEADAVTGRAIEETSNC